LQPAAVRRLVQYRLRERVGEIDLGHCPNCGGELDISAAIVVSTVVERTLTHLALQARALPRALACGDFPQAA